MKKATIIIVVFLLLLGGRYYFVYKNILGSDIPFSSQKVSFEGFVDEDPNVRDTNQRIIVTVTSNESSIRGKRVVFSVPKFPVYQYGTKLQVSGNLEQPKNFTTEKGEFNYRAYLAAKDIMYVINRPKVLYIGDEGGNLVVRKLLACKKLFVRNLELVLGEPHASLASGLLVGEKHSLSSELLDEFRRVGLTHIIVLSGYNIAIVVQTIGSMLVWLPRRIRIILSAVSVVLFCVLVGGGATVIRSMIMALIALFGEYIKKDYSPLRALLIAGYVMVFHTPLIALYDPSFQLSFIATLGLILLGKPLEKRCTWLPEKYGVRTLVSSTCATQIAVSPLILYLSGSISVGGIIVNFLVLPTVPVTMLSVFLTGITGFISYWLSYMWGIVSHLFLQYELFMVRWWAGFSWMAVEQSVSFEVTLVWYALYIVVLIIAFYKKQKTPADQVSSVNT
ncbi:MAG: ComEC/Rec2 family competence protein [Candidatus Taylorbacteria bacterium]|nr:ComEC/Rec2 family competence protein [Candidatus Taylorbacteria bacterium]